MFRCFTISMLLHVGLVAGILVLGFFTPPMSKKEQPITRIILGPPGDPTKPPGEPGPKASAPKPESAPEAPAPTPVPAKEEPAPTPAPTPAATPKPQATAAPTPAPTPRPEVTPPARPTPSPIVVAKKTPEPQTPVKEIKPAQKTAIKKLAPVEPPKKIIKSAKKELVIPTPKATPTPAPTPKVEEIVASVGPETPPEIPASAVPAPPVPALPPAAPPPVTGPGGKGISKTIARPTGTGAISNEITIATDGPGGNGTGGGGGGGGSLLNDLGQTYFMVVLNRIEENFNLPYSRPGERCQIQFTIEKAGNITNIQIMQRSNYDNLDHLAVQALEMTKLPPLYDGMQFNTLTVILTFNFEKKM